MVLRADMSFDDAAFKEALAGFRSRAADPRVVWDRVVDDFVAMERRVFATHGRSIDAPWPEAGARSRRGTARGSKRKVRRSAELLVLTGRLRRSLITVRGAGAIRRRGRGQLVLGTRVPTAELHDQRTKQGKGRLPQRRLVKITAETHARWVGIVRDTVFDEQRAARPL